MSKKVVYAFVLVLLLSTALPTHAASRPFSVMAFLDQHVCNDAQVGPNQNEQQIGVHVRDISARRRVGLFSFDISELKAPGAYVKNVGLSNLGAGGGNIDVYGVIEELDNLPPETELVWNNAPGVKNDPAPPVGDPIELDPDDLTDLLMTFDCPDNQVRASTATSRALADFINSDTDGIITLLFAPPQPEASAILRAKESNEGGIAGGTYLQGEIAFAVELAVNPDPANEADDAFRDAVLTWTPGQYGATHDVYFGTVLDDVSNASRGDPRGVLVRQGQPASSYDPGRLEFDQTYYWRIDEVNAPPTSTVYKGVVWSFTVEPFVHPVKHVTATASSFEEGSGPENTVNGSGLDADDLHSIDGETMWLSSMDGPQPAWIQYDLGRTYQLHEMLVWNYNGEFEDIIGFGIQNATIEYSTGGDAWTALGDFEFAQGTGLEGYEHNAPIDFGDVAARYVKITANSDWGGMGQPGLSEVRFLYIPTAASNPQPAAGQTGVALEDVLRWRPGREADTHDVYFGTDQQAVADGSALAGTTSDSYYAFGPLNLGETYYWRVDEVNEAEPVTVWTGDVWSFSATDFLVVDDFESYTDDEGNLIYETWIDGYESDDNGSQVGNDTPPYADQEIFHEGAQSMPLRYVNTGGAAYSEAKRTFAAPQDWAQGGATTLRLFFYGNADNDPAEPMWVKLTDQSGKSGTITYGTAPGEDTANLAVASWHEWQLMLADFGVDVSSVKTISIGFGSVGGVPSGNTGRVYIDDVQVGKPPVTP
ncbi:MAG: discoidin domain-containing protein [Sedimentisphaerales bacterium]|nr:discoidin domain-containing protein [Sedimentisphaerales bacterium]